MPAGLDIGVTRAFAARRLGVAPHVISMWVLDGWRAPDGTRRTVTVTGNGRRGRLYRYGDLVDAECDTRNSPNSSRNPRRQVRHDWAALDRNAA